MKWIALDNLNQLKNIDEASKNKKVLIFKHSTRCSISDAALGRLERNWNEDYEKELDCYYLDLIRYRELSNEIAARYQIHHESPQALVIKDGKCVFSQTHSGIKINDLILS